MSRLFPIPKLDTKFDSYIGKATFHWNKEEFLTIMKQLEFVPGKNKKCPHTKKFKVKGYQHYCTLLAFYNGTVVLNGCNGISEMEWVIEQLFLKSLAKFQGLEASLMEPVTIINFRAEANLNIKIDLTKMQKFFAEQYIKKDGTNRYLDFLTGINKLEIPVFIHKIKGVKIFVNMKGKVEVFKANLVKSLSLLFAQIYKFIHVFKKDERAVYFEQKTKTIKKKKPLKNSKKPIPNIQSPIEDIKFQQDEEEIKSIYDQQQEYNPQLQTPIKYQEGNGENMVEQENYQYIYSVPDDVQSQNVKEQQQRNAYGYNYQVYEEQRKEIPQNGI